MYYYIIAFLIIMVLYMFYNQDIDYYYQRLRRTEKANYAGRLINYYKYHMI